MPSAAQVRSGPEGTPAGSRVALRFAGGGVSSGEMLAVLHRLSIDQVTAEVITTLARNGVRSILLKGPSFSDWLYDDVQRLYGDTDVLVSPDDYAAAEGVLIALGFIHPPLEDIPRDKPWHAHSWLRTEGEREQCVDLHKTLYGAEADEGVVWSVLSANTERLRVGGRELEVLSVPCRLVHVALHAAQDGARLGKPLEDLTRALARVDLGSWADAVEIARPLGALRTFAAGLRADPKGRELIARLSLDQDETTELVLRSKGSVPEALAVDWFVRTKGFRNRVLWIAHKVFPPVKFMKASSPELGTGWRALARAYVRRWVSLARRTAPAVKEWRKAKEESR